jgi:hypothetical protein
MIALRSHPPAGRDRAESEGQALIYGLARVPRSPLILAAPDMPRDYRYDVQIDARRKRWWLAKSA